MRPRTPLRRLLVPATVAAAMALLTIGFTSTLASSSPSRARAHSSGRLAVGHAQGQQIPMPALGDLLTYDYGNTRSGEDTVDQAIKNLSSRPAWDDHSLDGAVYGEPLVYGGRVYVATENDSVYAIAARSGQVVWHLHVGTAVNKDIFDSAPELSGGCGDISPLGITGTPVIDAVNNEIFVAEETELAGQHGWQGIRHWLVAISLTTPHVLWSRDIDPPYPNNADHYYIAAEQQRPALTLANGHLYVAFGGLDGDCGQYHGYVVGLSATGSGALESYQVPTQREGAIWGTSGAVVSPEGDLYVATGNGSSTTTFDGSNAVIELSPTLKRIGYWAPSDWAELSAHDWDLGSAGPTNVPGTSLLFEAGKPSSNNDYGFLVREGHLRGIGRGAFSGLACKSGGDFGANASDIVGAGKNAVVYIYAACGGGTEAFRVTTSPVAFHYAWSPSSGSPNGSPIVAGGLVWALDWSNGLLYGMNPRSGHVVVQRSTGALEHFVAPAVGDKMLFVPTASGVEAFRTLG